MKTLKQELEELRVGVYYKLEGEQAVPCANFEEYALTAGRDNKVRDDLLPDGTHISTVFLMVNHGTKERPLLFETMVFGRGEGDTEMRRYETYGEAVKGHEEILRWYRDGLAPGETSDIENYLKVGKEIEPFTRWF